MKAQPIRVLDVLVIGPLMIYGSLVIDKKYRLTKTGLQIFGASTIVYNAYNYFRVKTLLQDYSQA